MHELLTEGLRFMAKGGGVSAWHLMVISVWDPLHAVKFTLLVHVVVTATGIPSSSRERLTLYGVSPDVFVD